MAAVQLAVVIQSFGERFAGGPGRVDQKISAKGRSAEPAGMEAGEAPSWCTAKITSSAAESSRNCLITWDLRWEDRWPEQAIARPSGTSP